MSHASDDDGLRTPPRRQGSSGILDTFRNIVRTRSKQSILHSPSSANISSPISVASSKDLDDSMPFDRLPSGSSGNDPQLDIHNTSTPIVNFCPSAAPEIQRTVPMLADSHTLGERIAGAKTMIALLQRFQVEDVMGTWSLAKDLLDDSDVSEAVQAGYLLLKALVSQKTLSPLECRYFFEAVSKERTQDKEDFKLRLDVLDELCAQGKYIESLGSPLLENLRQALKNRYELARRARAESRLAMENSRNAEQSLTEELDLNRVYTLISHVLKLNSAVLKEQDLQSLLEQLVTICKSTSTISDIRQSVDIVNAVVTYSSLPLAALGNCTEMLCGTYYALRQLRPATWQTICNLLRSHLSLSTMKCLVLRLREPQWADEPNSSTVHGAVQILHALMISGDDERLQKPSTTAVIPALKDTIILEKPSMIPDVLQLLCDFTTDNESFRELFLRETWSDYVEIIAECSRRLVKRSSSNELEPVPSVLLNGIITAISARLNDLEPNQKLLVVGLLKRLISFVDESTISLMIALFAELGLLNPPSEHWHENCSFVLSNISLDRKRSSMCRLQSIKAVHSAIRLGQVLDNPEADTLLKTLLEDISRERDLEILSFIVDEAVSIAQTMSWEDFLATTQLLQAPLLACTQEKSKYQLSTEAGEPARIYMAAGRILSNALVQLFMKVVNQSVDRGQLLYSSLLAVLESVETPADASIPILSLLFRLRCDRSFRVFIAHEINNQTLCTVLSRNTLSTKDLFNAADAKPPRSNKQAERMSTPQLRPKSTSSAAASVFRRLSTHGTTASTLTEPQEYSPLWSYPDATALPTDPPEVSSSFLRSNFSETHRDAGSLDFRRWLDFLISCLQQATISKVPDNASSQEVDKVTQRWEIQSFVLAHLPAQLANHSLFLDAPEQIRSLRALVCEQLRTGHLPSPPQQTGVKKSDVAVCLFHLLTELIGYHELYTKAEEEEIVRVLLHGVGGWEKTSETCIHALSICCYELPLSLTKSLESILQRMSQIITQAQAAVHILELLAGLARLPALIRNFRDEDFRMVFGMCFRYLQYARDQQGKTLPTASKLSHGSSRRISAVYERQGFNVNEARNKPLADEMPQYVYVLTYHVMTFWFMSAKIQARPQLMSWIEKNLYYTNADGQVAMDEQSEVLLDAMHRVAYTNRDETEPDHYFATPSDGVVQKENWLVGNSILTLETAGRTGLTQVTRRRASGTRHSIVQPRLVGVPLHQPLSSIDVDDDTFRSDNYICALPENVFEEMYSPLVTSIPLHAESLIKLPKDSSVERAINSFDRISALDGHKMGLIYVGEGQTKESEILSNVMGSYDFTEFVRGIGTLTKLNGATINTQGLDRENDMDGEFTYCWRDRVSEIVFHIPTLMPTDRELDPFSVNKKRHTGNDFVNIIFNNSGHSFAFDTFPSDFNYVNIIVEPEARASFIDTRLLPAATSADGLFYRVHVQTRPGIPAITPACDPKTISKASLPSFVRHLALTASYFSQVWAVNVQDAEHISSWRTRLREIKKLREKYKSALGSEPDIALAEQPSWDPRNSRRASAAFLGGLDG